MRASRRENRRIHAESSHGLRARSAPHEAPGSRHGSNRRQADGARRGLARPCAGGRQAALCRRHREARPGSRGRRRARGPRCAGARRAARRRAARRTALRDALRASRGAPSLARPARREDRRRARRLALGSLRGRRGGARCGGRLPLPLRGRPGRGARLRPQSASTPRAIRLARRGPRGSFGAANPAGKRQRRRSCAPGSRRVAGGDPGRNTAPHRAHDRRAHAVEAQAGASASRGREKWRDRACGHRQRRRQLARARRPAPLVCRDPLERRAGVERRGAGRAAFRRAA